MQKNVFKGLKILDHTAYLLGGYASQVFADLGAEVIKIENPRSGGDPGRTLAPFINGVSYYHSALDRNKKSVTINMKSEKGKAAYMRLLKEADIVMENFRPGVMKRLGIDYEVEKQIKPDIIHCSISAFGQDDPRSLQAFHDMNFAALCGYMYLNGPRHSALHMADMSSAMVAVQDMMAALLERNATGEGAFCDVAMFDSLVWFNAKLDSRYQFNNNHFTPNELTFKNLGTSIWELKDGGHVVLCLSENKFWNNFIELTGLEELGPHMFAREEDVPELFEKVRNIFLGKTMEEAKEWIGDRDICATFVNDKAQAIEYITNSGTGLMEYCDFPLTGKTIQTRIPHNITSVDTVPLSQASAPPELGENNVEVFKSVGYSMDEINEMAEEGAIGPIA
ncbi:MAG: CaiB/BaiF CoA-transferase family protein [Christensenella sp.]|uniref:CaiB/BaiF CoA transferase family protein n=1 Tax=Christensenella sp. TaxID=1935934 RepID=UPI002B1FC364|nr:CaiB/BaiF CoA-transferase family protein [Christensenella sp.]MEA5002508.1 CaiB/BaiF CoA-transferase family protein [Christensenella sp.]